jgi:hypothetical protein
MVSAAILTSPATLLVYKETISYTLTIYFFFLPLFDATLVFLSKSQSLLAGNKPAAVSQEDIDTFVAKVVERLQTVK